MLMLLAGGAEARASKVKPRASTVTSLSPDGQRALRALLGAKMFQQSAVGYAGSKPEVVKAFERLMRGPGADAAFKQLLRQGTLAGQLYALCGLYFTDPAAFRAALPRYRQRHTRVKMQAGCLIRSATVSELVSRPGAVRLAPNQTMSDWLSKNGAKARRGYHLDIAGGGYPWMFRPRPKP